MNIVRLNTVSLDGIIKKGSGGGGGVPINNQEKSLEITENGVTEVTADAGFTGLSKVVVNTNVQSGGGAMEYWRVPEGLSSTSDEYYIMAMFAMLVRADLTTLGETQICSGMLAITGVSDYITAFAFDPTAKVTMQGVLMSIRDLLAELGGDLSEAGFTKITEDEFYAIN